jgi:hypothetical protein
MPCHTPLPIITAACDWLWCCEDAGIAKRSSSCSKECVPRFRCRRSTCSHMNGVCACMRVCMCVHVCACARVCTLSSLLFPLPGLVRVINRDASCAVLCCPTACSLVEWMAPSRRGIRQRWSTLVRVMSPAGSVQRACVALVSIDMCDVSCASAYGCSVTHCPQRRGDGSAVHPPPGRECLSLGCARGCACACAFVFMW